MANNLLIAAVLLIAVASAGTMTTHSPPRNRTASPPPPPRKIASHLPASEQDSPPPPSSETASPPSPQKTASPPPASRNASASPHPPSRNASASPHPPPLNASAPPPPPAKGKSGGPTNCSDDLVAFSKCLPYISTYPNNETDSPPRQCCSDVTSAYHSGSAVCFCYLVQKPGLLGFPLNKTRILSLSDLCPIRSHGGRVKFSLQSLCSGSKSLPPLSSVTVPSLSKPRTPAIAAAPVPQNSDADYLEPPPSGEDFSQDDTSTPGQDDNAQSPEETVQVFPAWRSFDINSSSAVPAGFSRSWWLSAVLLLVFFPTDCM